MQRRQHQMPGQCRLHRDLCGFAIADFADHDHVRVLPQDRPQQAGERQTDLRPHLDLVDPAQLVLDRILDRDDLARHRIQRQQPGIQCRGLAAARRSGHQHDPVGQVQRRPQFPDHPRRQPKARVVEHHRRAVEDAQHHRLPVQRRDRGNTEINVLAAHRHLDAPVLRHPPLGDIKPRHDLDPRRDRRGQDVAAAAPPHAARRHSDTVRAAGPRTARYGCRRHGSRPRA